MVKHNSIRCKNNIIPVDVDQFIIVKNIHFNYLDCEILYPPKESYNMVGLLKASFEGCVILNFIKNLVNLKSIDTASVFTCNIIDINVAQTIMQLPKLERARVGYLKHNVNQKLEWMRNAKCSKSFMAKNRYVIYI